MHDISIHRLQLSFSAGLEKRSQQEVVSNVSRHARIEEYGEKKASCSLLLM